MKFERDIDFAYWECKTAYPDGNHCYSVDAHLFPNMDEESDPKEVEITIKIKE